MSNDRKKQAPVVTPVGTAQWPRVNSPDTRFDEDGEYRCNLIVDKKEFTHFKKTLLKLYEEAYTKEQENQGKKRLKKWDSFPCFEDDDGNLVIKTKRKAVWTDRDGNKKPNQIALHDAKGSPIMDAPIVGGGSKLRLSVRPKFWYTGMLGFGCSLDLLAVQVLDLADYQPQGTDFGFSAEEGYIHGGETFDDTLEDDDAKEEKDNELDEETETEDALANF